MRTYKFKAGLEGMTCAVCTGTIKKALLSDSHLSATGANVSLAGKVAFVSLQSEEQELIRKQNQMRECISDVGFECTEIISLDEETLPPLIIIPPEIRKKKRRAALRKQVFKGMLGIVFGLGLIALSATGVGLPFAVAIGLTVLSVSTTVWLGYPVFQDAWKKWRKARTLNMNSLFTLSTLVVLTVSLLSFVIPGLALILDVGLLIFGFLLLGKAIEGSLENTLDYPATFRSLAQPVLCNPLSQEKETRLVQPCDLQPGDRIRVRRGEVIPVDGILESEVVDIDNSSITGMGGADTFLKGDTVVAGMMAGVSQEDVVITVTKHEAQSNLVRLDRQLEVIQAEAPPIQLRMDKMLQYFIPAILGLALVTGIVVGVLFNPFLALQCVVSVLVSACPCILGYIAARLIKMGARKALDHGVEFKNAESLEAAAAVNALMFDVNGTLTKGEPRVMHWVPLDEKMEEESLLDDIIALEGSSRHRVGSEICKYARSRKKTLSQKAAIVPKKNGKHHAGIQGDIDQHTLMIGDEKYLRAHQVLRPETLQHQEQPDDQVNYVVRDGRVVGYFVLRDEMRPEVPFVLETLQRKGYEVYFLTGGKRELGLFYAKECGVPADHVYGSAAGDTSLPHNKCERIKALQALGKRVAMVGDGGNDALSMAQSDCGIAIHSPYENRITQSKAAVVVREASVLPVLTTLEVSKDTLTNLRRCLTISLGYNMTTLLIAGGVLLAVGFALNPAVGVALMIVQAVLVLYLQKRFMQGKVKCLEDYARYQAQDETPVAASGNTYSFFKRCGIFGGKHRALDLHGERSEPSAGECHYLKMPPMTRAKKICFDGDKVGVTREVSPVGEVGSSFSNAAGLHGSGALFGPDSGVCQTSSANPRVRPKKRA